MSPANRKNNPLSKPIVFLLLACSYQFSKTEDRGACSPNGFTSGSCIARFFGAAVLVRGCAAAVAAAKQPSSQAPHRHKGKLCCHRPRPEPEPSLSHSGALSSAHPEEQQSGQALTVHPARVLLLQQGYGHAAGKPSQPQGTKIDL